MPRLHWLLIAPIRAFAKAHSMLADASRSKFILDCVDNDTAGLEAKTIELTIPHFNEHAHQQAVSSVRIPRFLLAPAASLSVKQATFDFSAEIESSITHKTTNSKACIDLQCRLGVEKKRRRSSRTFPTLQCSAKLTARAEPEGVQLIKQRLNAKG